MKTSTPKKLHKTFAAAAILLAALFMFCACSSQNGADNRVEIGFDIGNSYAAYNDNAFISGEKPSYFALHSNTASYANFRRHVTNGYALNRDAVRADEFINYFNYSHPILKNNEDVALSAAVYDCIWQPDDFLLRLGMATRDIAFADIHANLVFLVDVSGSMMQPDRLQLAKTALTKLVRSLAGQDNTQILTGDSRISLVAYAGDAHTVISGSQNIKQITDAIEGLSASGVTHGQQGIVSAFSLAEQNYIEGGNNRILLLTDGDFNLGLSGAEELRNFIQDTRLSLKDSGKEISLHTVGFGYGNLRDDNLQALASVGGGGYTYVDSYGEAHRAFAESFKQELIIFAAAAKAMVQFNAQYVDSYRQIGYEFYQLNALQWQDDTLDAGKLGYGHTVTALYQFRLKDDADIQNLAQIAEFVLKYTPIKNTEEQQNQTQGTGEYTADTMEIKLSIDGTYYTNSPQNDDIFISCTALTALALRDTAESTQKLALAYQTLNSLYNAQPDYFSDIYKAEFLQLLSAIS